MEVKRYYRIQEDGVYEIESTLYWSGSVHWGELIENRRSRRKVINMRDLERLEDSGVIQILKPYKGKAYFISAYDKK